MTADRVWPATDIVAGMEQAVLGRPPAPALASMATMTDPLRWSALIGDLVKSNLRQWDLEDTTRDPGATDTDVAAAKRQIDRLNSHRHGLIYELDGAIDAVLDQAPSAPLATESPGMVLDRMSVLVIRRARTAEASRQHAALAARLDVIESQISALSQAWDCYIDELRSGTRRFHRYESLKLYGVPAGPPPAINE